MESIQTVESFMNGGLVAWLSSCYRQENGDPLSYKDIIDGVAIHTVFLQMEMTISNNAVVTSSDDYKVRLKNLAIVLENVTVALEEDVKCLVLQRPDIEKLAMNPQLNVAEVEILISLLLSCAVNSPKATKYINGFMVMDKDNQHELMVHLNNIENIPGVILKLEMMINQKSVFEEHCNNVRKAFDYMRKIYEERNELRETLYRFNTTDESLFRRKMSSLSRLKYRVRQQQHELEEKTDALIECQQVANDLRAQLTQQLKDKELSLLKYRETKESYEEELEDMSKKIAKLEEDLEQYKKEAKEHENCQAEIDKLCDQVREFQDTKEDMEDHMLSDDVKIRSLALEVDKLNSTIDVLADEKESLRKSYQDILDENKELQSHVQGYNSTILESGDVFDAEEEFEHSFEFKNSTLSEQLYADVQSKNVQQQLVESLNVAINFSPIKAPRQLDTELKNRLQQVAECSYEQQHELEELKEKYTKLEGDLKLMQLEKERLQQEVDAKKKLEREFKALRELYDELKRLSDKTVTSATEEPNTTHELAVSERRMSRVQMLIPDPNRVAYLTRANKQLIAERNSLLVYKDMMKSARETMRFSPEEAKDVAERLRQKNDEMEAEIRSEKETNQSLLSENAMLKAMQSELEHLSEKTHEAMREKCDELRQHNSELRQQFDFSEQKLDRSSCDEGSDGISESFDKDRRILELSMDLDNTRFQVDEANKMKEKLEMERNHLFKNNRVMSQQIQDMYNRLVQARQSYFEDVQTIREQIATVRQKQWIDANVVIASYKNADSLKLKKKKGLMEKCVRRFSESVLGRRHKSSTRRNSDPNSSGADKDNPKTPTERSSLLVILRKNKRKVKKNVDDTTSSAEQPVLVEEDEENLPQIEEEAVIGNTENLQSGDHVTSDNRIGLT